jgi:hypothetical protein
VITEKNKIDVPKTSAGDHLHTGTRTLISAIPLLGGPALELFNALLQTPIEKRQQEWREKITLAIIELQKSNGIKIEDLQNNEQFISVLTEATIVAIKTHNQQKKELLKTAVVNSALGITIDDDSAVLFVRYIDELTSRHILLLRQLHLHPESLKIVKGYEELYELFSEEVGSTVSKDAFKFLCEDLATRGLVRISQFIDDFNDIYEPGLLTDGGSADQSRIRVTDLGNDFLANVMVES